jgi:hypothetical protein
MDEEETPLRSVNLLSPVAERKAFLRSPLCFLLLVLFVSFAIFNTRALVPFDLLPLTTVVLLSIGTASPCAHQRNND